MRKNSVKNNRVSMEVQRTLSEIIRTQIKDPRMPDFVSLTDVYVAPDLKTCKAYVSALGPEENLKAAIECLTRAAGFIRSRLAHEMNLRNTPEIKFIADGSIGYGVSMSKQIDDVIEEDERKRREAEGAAGITSEAREETEE